MPAPRIIPTRMGTRPCYKFCTVVKRDHPHAYGDKHKRNLYADLQRGSSPCVWGQEDYKRERRLPHGIIPTRMGTRRRNSARILMKRDHPHAYGDKCIPKIKDLIPTGSSPRVWGQVVQEIKDGELIGDHPHAYGDKALTALR